MNCSSLKPQLLLSKSFLSLVGVAGFAKQNCRCPADKGRKAECQLAAMINIVFFLSE